MSVIESLVFDRTQKDVDALDAFFLGVQAGTVDPSALDLTMARGAYNVTDLNRVTEVMEYLHDRLTEYGYRSGYEPVEVFHTDGTADHRWREEDEDVTADKLEEYLANVRTIREALPILPGTPHCPADMDELTVEDANAIERILHNLEQVITAMRTALLRAGQVLLHSGGPAIYLRDAQKNFIAVYTVDREMVATADWFAVAVKEE